MKIPIELNIHKNRSKITSKDSFGSYFYRSSIDYTDFYFYLYKSVCKNRFAYKE